MHNRRWTGLLCLLGVALITAACGGARPSAADSATATLDQAALPTNPPVSTSTQSSGTGEPPAAVNEYGLPLELTGNEIIAARFGQAVYSGYTCTIAPVGCACEQPVLEQVAFTFDDNDHMNYRFEGDGYATTWRMNRLGANQWGYTQGYTLEGTDSRVAHIVLLTFIDTGFIRNDGAVIDDGVPVTCPDVTFRRLPSSTPQP
jgi:hypothetical protein